MNSESKGVCVMKKINWKHLLMHIAVPLIGGMLVGMLVNTDIYGTIETPPLSPPPIVFPIAWTILYILMGISSYLIGTSSASMDDKRRALRVYRAQLIVNFLWTPIFFGLGMFGLAFIWLVLLYALVVLMILLFYRIDPKAALLQIPYLLWLTFAGYLNFMIWIMN